MMITEIPLTILRIESDGFHILTHGFINNKAAAFLIDTGASRTVFDLRGIRDYIPDQEFEENERLSTGLGTNTMESQVAMIESLQFGSLLIPNYTAIIIDLQHVHQSYEMLGLPVINGVLGGDILLEYKCIINYKKKRLKFYH